MPRSGKMANNKKSKVRNAEKRVQIESQRELEAATAAREAGAYTRPLFRSTCDGFGH
jgi:hypothetical protein